MTKKSAITFSFFISNLLLLLSSCNKEEPTPAYISINSFSLTSDYATQGTNSQNIKDAWVYVDGQVLGVYELPARIPVLKDGRHDISIAAGILVNGIAATRIKYPFYNFFDTVATFVAGKTFELPALVPVKYSSGLQYTWYEDFDGSGYTFKESPTSDALLMIDNTDVFQGVKSAKFTLNTSLTKFYGEMDDGFPIVTQNKTFLELNYKADQPFSIGMKVTTGTDSKSVYALTVNNSAFWNKIYIDLSKIVNENQNADNFRVYIYAELEAGRNESVVHIDNLKLLHN